MVLDQLGTAYTDTPEKRPVVAMAFTAPFILFETAADYQDARTDSR